MSGYRWGVLTPFAIVLGILLLWLAGSLFAALSAFVCDRLGFGVPWLPSGLHAVSAICGLVVAFSLAAANVRDDIRRLGRSIDEAGQSGRK